jgi:uncharacterized protein (TIGR03437 family)
MMRLRFVVLLTTILCCSAWGQTYTISTFAGSELPLLNIPGTSASLAGVAGIAADPAGNLFFVDQGIVLRLDATTGVLTLVAGNGECCGFSGDNGPATSAQLYDPMGVAVDSAGNLYIADGYNYRIRKVSGGVISTVAGGGSSLADNVPATSAQLYHPDAVAVDSAGNLYILDHYRIRKVSNGVISTVAGNGVCCAFGGDNGPATSASLFSPTGIAVDSAGNLYIADTGNNRIREVTNGVITTVAGTGMQGFSGDNGPATSAQLFAPYGVAVDSAGNLYIADLNNFRVREVSNGAITTVAGNGTLGFGGDNGPATSAYLSPMGVALDSAGNLYIADGDSYRIRKVSTGVITTVAGGGSSLQDNVPAASAQLAAAGLAVDSAGNLYMSDGNLIQRVSHGVITTVAGAGWSLADNIPATSAQLTYPEGVAVDAAGNLYVADSGSGRVRKISNGLITTVAGNGTWGGFSGDNGPAASAQLWYPGGLAVDSAGNLYIADVGNNRVRKVSNGVITTVAGNGTQGFNGDNIPATSAQLYGIGGLAVDSAGDLYIVDSFNNRIRKVSNGVITTVAGNGTRGFSGDDGPTTSAQLSYPNAIAMDSAGNLYIVDGYNDRIRKVSNGVITTVAGNGTPGFSGDNIPAVSAELNYPIAIAVDSAGNVYIADYAGSRILILTPGGSPCRYLVSPTTLQAPASGANTTVNIQAAASCPWTVSGLPGWITVSSASSGPASATVTFLVSPSSGAPVSATVLVAGVPVTITQPAAALAPLAPIKSVTNAASYITGAVSAGELVTIFGAGIGPANAAYATTDPSTGKLATTIGGVQVLFNGIPAPMIYAGSTQVSAVVPYETAPISNPSVWIDCAGHTSNAYQLSLGTAAPGVFAQNASGSGPGAILNQDNSLNGPAHPAAKASIVQVYMTGEGQTSPQGVTGAITTVTLPPPQVTPAPVQPIQVWINGQQALYMYAGEAPGMVAGVMQINVQIPASAPSGPLSIQVSIGGNISQTGITVSVQ